MQTIANDIVGTAGLVGGSRQVAHCQSLPGRGFSEGTDVHDLAVTAAADGAIHVDREAAVHREGIGEGQAGVTAKVNRGSAGDVDRAGTKRRGAGRTDE